MNKLEVKHPHVYDFGTGVDRTKGKRWHVCFYHDVFIFGFGSVKMYLN